MSVEVSTYEEGTGREGDFDQVFQIQSVVDDVMVIIKNKKRGFDIKTDAKTCIGCHGGQNGVI